MVIYIQSKTRQADNGITEDKSEGENANIKRLLSDPFSYQTQVECHFNPKLYIRKYSTANNWPRGMAFSFRPLKGTSTMTKTECSPKFWELSANENISVSEIMNSFPAFIND